MNCCCDPLTIVPAGKLRVSDEAAAGELRSGRAVVHEGHSAAADVDPAHRRRLRDRPELGPSLAARAAGDVDRQVRQRSPEIVERDAVRGARRAREALVVDVDGTVDDHVIGRRAEAGDLGVVADLEDQRIGGACRSCPARTRARTAGCRTGWGPAGWRSRRPSPGSGSAACSA